MAFTIPNNVILLVCVAVVGSIIGFIAYGLIVGFENTFRDFDDKPSDR
jgi:hypothetical protein